MRVTAHQPLPGFKLKSYLKQQQREVDQALSKWLPKKHDLIETLYLAMHHSMFSGGKRLRPILLLAAAQCCRSSSKAIVPAAIALECIHTYSLIHDDLPAMDDDDWRRGQPTCHKVYGEATAILAGDALLTYAFELMTQAKAYGSNPQHRLIEAINLLAHASGMSGMVGGQLADMKAEGRPVDLPTVEYIHTHKTGYLIMAACRMGALLAGGDRAQVKALTVYGESLGLAFQIVDDILNVTGEAEKMGKQTGTDVRRGKATYPALMGVEQARMQAEELVERGCRALASFGQPAQPLLALAKYILEREV